MAVARSKHPLAGGGQSEEAIGDSLLPALIPVLYHQCHFRALELLTGTSQRRAGSEIPLGVCLGHPTALSELSLQPPRQFWHTVMGQ